MFNSVSFLSFLYFFLIQTSLSHTHTHRRMREAQQVSPRSHRPESRPRTMGLMKAKEKWKVFHTGAINTHGQTDEWDWSDQSCEPEEAVTLKPPSHFRRPPGILKCCVRNQPPSHRGRHVSRSTGLHSNIIFQAFYLCCMSFFCHSLQNIALFYWENSVCSAVGKKQLTN